MPLHVTDVERLKIKIRKMAAGRELTGEEADVCLDLARMAGCRAHIAAGHGPLSPAPQAGFAEVHGASGAVTHIGQGESTLLACGLAHRLVFPQVSLYLIVEPEERR